MGHVRCAVPAAVAGVAVRVAQVVVAAVGAVPAAAVIRGGGARRGGR